MRDLKSAQKDFSIQQRVAENYKDVAVQLFCQKKTPSRTTVKVAGTAGKLTSVKEEEVQNALENVSKPNSTNEKG